LKSHSAEALLLDVVDLHDGDRVVSFLTREHGKKRGVARGAKRKHSRFAGELQPLAKAAVSWFEKDGRDLVRISSVELVRSPAALQRSLDDLLLGAYLAEHVLEFAQEDEPSDPLFRLLDASIEALLAGRPRPLVARYLETWVLRLQGIFPPPLDCPHCGRALGDAAALAPNQEAILCRDCAGREGLRVAADVLDFLRRSARAGIDQIQADDATLRRVEDLCGRVRRRFLQHELRSVRVLRQVAAQGL
jgi:DNA repair protein RecO (recombination protein O)